jgi:hypothetical protein
LTKISPYKCEWWLVHNSTTKKVPPSLLARADEVIE